MTMPTDPRQPDPQPMRHPEAHERLADLTLDPTSLDRLARQLDGAAAIDPLDRLFVAHVASCDACRTELQAASRVTRGLERALAGLPAGAATEPIEPPTSLRAATLAAVHAERVSAAGAAAASTAAASRRTASPAGVIGRIVTAWQRLAAPARFGGAIAALLVVAVIGAAVGNRLGRGVTEPPGDSLVATLATLDRVLAAPDHRVAQLVSPAGTAVGSVAWTHHDFTVLTASLATPSSGQVYRCWLVWAGRADLVGQMDFAGAVAYWTGAAGSWSDLTFQAGTRFEVTLEPLAAPSGSAPTGPIVLQADLGA